MTTAQGRRVRGFSLMEVVIAVGVFASAIVAILALMQPVQQRVDDQFDGAVAKALVQSIQAALEEAGFDNVVAASGAVNPIELVASADGSRVRVVSNTPPVTASADNTLDDALTPGIAERDRYFLVRVFRHEGTLAVTPAFIALRAEVYWPFQLPMGPGSATTLATGPGADPFRTTEAGDRRRVIYNFVLNP